MSYQPHRIQQVILEDSNQESHNEIQNEESSEYPILEVNQINLSWAPRIPDLELSLSGNLTMNLDSRTKTRLMSEIQSKLPITNLVYSLSNTEAMQGQTKWTELLELNTKSLDEVIHRSSKKKRTYTPQSGPVLKFGTKSYVSEMGGIDRRTNGVLGYIPIFSCKRKMSNFFVDSSLYEEVKEFDADDIEKKSMYSIDFFDT